MKHALLLAAAGAALIAACSSSSDGEPDAQGTDAAGPSSTSIAATTAGSPATTITTTPSATAGRVLALEGLGDLVIGQPIPRGSSFAERGAQINATCRTVSSPEFPGVYAMTEGGQVRRITVGQRSDVELAEGIGVGATEAEVLAAFPGFRATPHKYVAAPGKYLTQPGSDPRLRFEIGEDGRVSLIHAGLMPQLGYVEGCA